MRFALIIIIIIYIHFDFMSNEFNVIKRKKYLEEEIQIYILEHRSK